jgi:uncharacterized protein (TIGR03084 family)
MSNAVLDAVLADLAAESDQLESWVTPLAPAEGAVDWTTVTTPEGWTISHQIAHLAWTDNASLIAINGGEPFEQLMNLAIQEPVGFVDAETEAWSERPPFEQLSRWQLGRADLARALQTVPDGVKIPWFGPPMSPTSMATARFMETWAHGHDVAEGLGKTYPQNDRCKHVCHIGVRARANAYAMRGEQDPGVELRVELTAPSGELWTWGGEDAENRVTGKGYDFALLATRRRQRGDVDVHAEGPAADTFLDVVQAFAGMSGNDPKSIAERPTAS